MGKNHSKDKFNQWDLDRFSNITHIPRDKVEKLYQEFITTTGKDNRMDKKEFRRLYKDMYASRQVSADQTGPSAPNLWTDRDLEKIADRVFKAFDKGGSGKLTFEEFVNAYLLIDNNLGPIAPASSSRDRYNYIVEHNNPTPGHVSREQGEQFFNHLNQFHASDEKPTGNTNWEHHWTKIDDGTGIVTQEKFVEYVTNADDYKTSIKPGSA